jgi:hypothetical protein
VTPTPRRSWLALGYLLCAAAGASSLFWHSPAVAAAGLWAYLWGILLVLGGTSAAVGVLREHWLGEYVGLWGLISVWAVYCGVITWLGFTQNDPTRAPGALALAAIAVLMVWRWFVVSVERTAARELRDRG